MATFQKEDRYLVLKRSDIEKYLSNEQASQLETIANEVAAGRMSDAKDDLECVVVQDDWPMYDEVWNMIRSLVETGDHRQRSYPDLIDKIDMYQDEFMRIKALSKDSEIHQFCDRALSDIESRLPVLDQRDRACALIDRIKADVEGWHYTMIYPQSQKETTYE